jgi:hypothetical protein
VFANFTKFLRVQQNHIQKCRTECSSNLTVNIELHLHGSENMAYKAHCLRNSQKISVKSGTNFCGEFFSSRKKKSEKREKLLFSTLIKVGITVEIFKKKEFSFLKKKISTEICTRRDKFCSYNYMLCYVEHFYMHPL